MYCCTLLFAIILASLCYESNCQTTKNDLQMGDDVLEDLVLINDTSEFSTETVRLPKNLRPVEYFIRILPHEVGNLSFEGHVDIEFLVVERTREIWFHSGVNLHLQGNSTVITRRRFNVSSVMKIIDNYYIPEYQLANIVVDEEFLEGDVVTFSADFIGQYVTNAYGLNYIEYIDDKGVKKRTLATYFQPTGARNVFPCLDEPNFKAKFTLQVARRNGERILSNMMISKTIISENNKFTWVEFHKSISMSTYLVAFVVCDFDRLQRRAENQKPIRVWGRESALSKAEYAADLATEVMQWLESYTGVEYPLPKLDIITLPNYPVSGMENFGIIMTQEGSLLINSRMNRKDWVSNVVAHEVAHQWAGNLVTPSWWSEFWISEGMATYFSSLALDELRPSQQAMNTLMERIMWIRRSDDYDQGSTLMKTPFNPLVNDLKDFNIYYKGAAVLRMTKSIIGENNFAKSLHTYFNKHKFASVSQTDLFDCFVQSSDAVTLPESLHVILRSWTETKSYPYILVERNSQGKWAVKQEFFVDRNKYDGTVTIPSSNASLWWVPISLATSGNPDFSNSKPKLWIPPSREPVIIEERVAGAKDTWIVLNVQQSAYITVNYDAATWSAISKQLFQNHNMIHELNRAQLIDDSFRLLKTGHVEANIPFELINYISKERSYLPFSTLFDNLESIELKFRGEPVYPLLVKYLLSLVSPLVSENLGEDHINVKFKHKVLSLACQLRHPQCIKLASSQFQLWKRNYDDGVFSEFATESFLCAAVEAGSSSDWDVVFNQYFLRANSTGEKRSLMKALSCTRLEKNVIRFLKVIQNPSNGLTDDDAGDIFNSLIRSYRWTAMTWSYLRSNMKTIQKRFENFPLPFVEKLGDFNQIKLILMDQLKNGYSQENIDEILRQKEVIAIVKSRMIQGVSNWLKNSFS